MLGQLGQHGHPSLPQSDVGEAQVPRLVLPLPLGVEDVDVPPGLLMAGAAQVDQKSVSVLGLSLGPALLLVVGVLAAVARAGRFITGRGHLTPRLGRFALSPGPPVSPPITAALQVSPGSKLRSDQSHDLQGFCIETFPGRKYLAEAK